MAVYQSTVLAPPEHRAGLILHAGRLYRPHVIRVVYDHSWPPLSRRPSGRPVAMHEHAVYHVIITHAGVGDCRFRGPWCEIPAESVLCVSPGDMHAIAMDRKGCRYSAVNFEMFALDDDTALSITLDTLLSDLAGVPRRPRPAWPLLDLGEGAERMRTHAGEVYRAACEGQLEGAAALQRFLVELASYALDSAPRTEGTGDAEIDAVRRRLELEYARALTLDDLARSANLSRRSLTRRFRASYGTSPLAYQKELRLRAAQMMLRASDLQIQQIAREVGFGDVYQFSKAFRQHTGRTASETRRGRRSASRSAK